ncbi:site-specific DNA-methyltransferase [bacterium]|nr:site-specific DNA-methyltransferase [bacterium]
MPVVYQDFDSEEAEYAFIQADNAIALWAELDLSGINADIADLGPDFDIDLLGIKNFEIDVADKDFEADEDEIPEARPEPKVVRGEVYILGNHRLMCGDSTSITDVERLINGEKADMVFTDPPYGVDYDGGHATEKRREKLANDDKTLMYSGALPMAYIASNDKAPLYLWFADRFAEDVLKALEENNYQVRNWIIWNKNLAQFGAIGAQYKSKHEPCIYAFKKGCSPIWDGPNNEVTVWDVKREAKNEHHPTQKPVELCERAISNHNPKTVLDLFGGSGSTMISCEKTNKSSFTMELDPIYCGVILDRWQKFTGKKAHREDGKPWDEIKGE